jgi:hypothetical protein
MVALLARHVQRPHAVGAHIAEGHRRAGLEIAVGCSWRRGYRVGGFVGKTAKLIAGKQTDALSRGPQRAVLVSRKV